MKYRFINDHRQNYPVATMCRILGANRAEFYAWLNKPLSDSAIDNQRLLSSIRDSHPASGRVYGSRRVYAYLRETVERCGKNRVTRLMHIHKIKAVRGYKAHRPVHGRPSLLAPNTLYPEFTVDAPDKTWVTDITHIRTWQDWLYLPVVLDLYFRRVVGWSMKPTIAKELVLDALLMAVWRRKPTQKVLVHSDQGSQYGSDGWRRFCLANQLEPSMSRRGNCWDNAVAESFFSSLKKSASENASTKPANWPKSRSLITSRRFTIEPDATVTSVMSAPRPLNVPQREAGDCLNIGGTPPRRGRIRPPPTPARVASNTPLARPTLRRR